jgi:sec-independent protein translocase protein TatC
MSAEDQKGGTPPNGTGSSPEDGSETTHPVENVQPETGSSQPDDPYGHYEDPYASGESGSEVSTQVEAPAVTAVAKAPPPPPPPPPAPPQEPEDEEEEGMLRMSFMEHLEELRSRIIKMLAGVAVAFVLCLVFANQLWEIISAPAIVALRHLGYTDRLVQITPMETFSTVWVKVPMLTCIFVASPWILYQVWAFIAPGLYKRERRWAAPFVICTAGLFILGGLFAYFVAFRYGLEFLLGIGRDIRITPMVSITEYFDLFVNVTLGIGLVFEMPVLIFFLTLLHIVSPKFLVRHSRYAVLAIVVLAAIVTPTPDVFNLLMFAIPMCALYFVGVFAGYLLVLRRENRRFPWKTVVLWSTAFLIAAAILVGILISHYGYRVVQHWPYLVR